LVYPKNSATKVTIKVGFGNGKIMLPLNLDLV